MSWRALLAGALGLATRQDLDDLRREVRAMADLSVEQLWERAGSRAAALMAEASGLRDSVVQMTSALAQANAALGEQQSGEASRVQTAVQDALALQAVKDAERVRGLLAALGDEMPVDVPATPETPAPGEPAVIPETPSGVETPPVDESALPTTDGTGEVTGDVTDNVAPVVESEGQTGGDQASS